MSVDKCLSVPVAYARNVSAALRLYKQHQGQFSVSPTDIQGDHSILSPDETSSIDAVTGFYGIMQGYALSELVHREAPWRTARGGLPQGLACNERITDASMVEYYSSLA